MNTQNTHRENTDQKVTGCQPVTEPLDLDPGLYWDESVRTLEEVTRDLAYWLEDLGLYLLTDEDREIVKGFRPDPTSGLYRTDEDPEIWQDLYRDLSDCLSFHLSEGLWFGYDGGWGIWQDEEESY